MNNFGVGQKDSQRQQKGNKTNFTPQQNKAKGRKKEEGGVNVCKKKRVFINKSQQQQVPKLDANCSFGSPSVGPSNRPPPLFPSVQQQQFPVNVHQQQSSSSNYLKEVKCFGPTVPEMVMEDILFRFLYNIPNNEKENQIRVCFHIELAHWFFLDFYCSDNCDVPERLRSFVPCQRVGFAQFVRQVFTKCDFLDKWRYCVDQIITEFHYHKSHVPTYGVIMLDPTLNYVLLVQGYYASKNSWGFPKGKINEDEVPLNCALREAFEEVGFDATEHIKNPEKCRPLQHFFGETLVRLFLATDVPMDFPFKPHLRKEIRKICWFFLQDLPKFHKDNDGCARLGNGLTSNCFYGVIPFAKDICDFVERERRERNKPKCTILKAEHGSTNSAFQPVIPRASSHQKLPTVSSNVAIPALSSQMSTDSTISRRCSTVENLFKPLKPDPAILPTSFTGQSFLEHIGAAKIAARESDNTTVCSDGSPQIPTNPAGVIGSEANFRRSKEIKHPKPMHPTGPVVVVYEAPPQQQTSPDNATQRETKQPKETGKNGNEIVEMLRSSIVKMSVKQKDEKRRRTPTIDETIPSVAESEPQKEAPLSQQTLAPNGTADFVQLAQFVPTQVRKCEAWKKFTLDRTRLQPV
ncbi:hypothetical protein niasHS_012167 [Heterodera schachtii]|uniref:mRNA-decapping enzyme 2 n=1 Tax=Heterodera schachtii TaxID=97005 RepID=A0ABD2IEB4_HETSC